MLIIIIFVWTNEKGIFWTRWCPTSYSACSLRDGQKRFEYAMCGCVFYGKRRNKFPFFRKSADKCGRGLTKCSVDAVLCFISTSVIDRVTYQNTKATLFRVKLLLTLLSFTFLNRRDIPILSICFQPLFRFGCRWRSTKWGMLLYWNPLSLAIGSWHFSFSKPILSYHFR